MGLKSSINAVAKAAVLTDTADLQGLVALCELLRQLSSDAASEGKADIAASSSEAADLSEGIVLRQVNDVEAAFQRVLEAINLCDTACEQASAPQREPADPELLTAWVASCEAAIPELEHLTVHAETNGFVGETAADIRRRIHTLKGECGVLSLSEAQSICHDLETLLDSSTDSFPAEAVLAVCDWMKSLANTLAMDQCSNEPDSRAVRATLSPQVAVVTEVIAVVSSVTTSSTATATPSVCAVTDDDGLRDLDSIPADLKVYMNLENADENIGDFALEAREHLANAEAAVLSLEVTPNDAELVNVVFRAFHTIKGVAGFLHLPRIVEVAHASEFLLDKVRSHKIPLTTHVLELVLASSDLLGQLIGMLSGGEPPRERELKVLVRRVEAACEGRVIGAMSSSDSNAPKVAASTLTTPTTSDVKDSLPQDTNSAPIADVVAATTLAKTHATNKADQTVKVSTQRMDTLVNLVGELVIAQLMVVQDPEVVSLHEQRVQRNLAHLGKIVRDLQETSMSLRMVTLKSTFQKMARLVRDVASKAGKRIQLEVEGEDVELDRNVVEEIGDPLVHMIRNACDHGIEGCEDRRAAGKTEHGTLRLRAFHSGGSIVIEVEDDGRGLQRERILRKCLEKGLIDPSRNLSDIPDNEVYSFVFLPGFSTAEKVTDISGRGVGMDVVRRNIEALRGTVEIHSDPGKGSVFSMRLPLTMAIIDGMVVRIGTQRYIIPTLNIERTFRPSADQITTVLGKGEVVKVRGNLLPIHRLRRVFNLQEGVDELHQGLLLVLESGKRRSCVFVDEILGQQQVVIKSLGESRSQIRGVSGGAILGDGRVALIVDVGGLLETAAHASVAAA